ncbi:MAG: PAS domain-containing protein [Acidobacteria bacterium]|nr:MAG: PAS domain-containing protein [Acidobacteriota bacterium]REK03641.1 MAG: PAS domain-containing protein [Acidobacteriota bacterium]
MLLHHAVRRRLVLGVLLVATALVAAVGSFSFAHRVQGFRESGIELARGAEGWRVTAVAAPLSELSPGDLLVLVDGLEIPPRVREAEVLGVGEREVVVIRSGELASVRHLPPPPRIDVAYLLLAGIAVFYLGIGIYTLLRTVDRQTCLFHLWCLVSATLYVVSPEIPFRDSTGRFYYGLDQAVRLLLPPLTLHFFLVFPRPLRQVRSGALRLLIPALYAPPMALLAFLLDQMLTGGSLFAGPATALSIRVLDRVELALIALYVVAAVLVLIAQGLRFEPKREERQLLWIALGLAIGYLPFLALHAVPYAAGIETPQLLRALAVAPLVLVPLSFAWAILRYRLWDISVILRDLATYALTLSLGGFGFAVLSLLVQRGIPDSLAVARGVTTVAGGLLIAGLLLPTKQGIGATLERLHYRGALTRRRALGELGEELLLERDLEQLCRALLFRLEEALAVERSNLFLVRGEAMTPVSPEPDLEPLRSSEIDSRIWGNEYFHLEGVGLPGSEPHAERRLAALGYRTAFPLSVRSRRIGLLLLGDKANGASLSSDDAMLVRQLLNQAALAIENAQLIEHMQQQLQEVVELKQFNEEIIESSPAGIAVLDGDDRVLTANLAFAALFGFERAALRRRRIDEVLPGLDLPSSESSLLDTEYVDGHGRRRQLQISTAGLLGERRQRMKVVVVNDTTEIREMERALQEKERLATIGLMAAGVAHEVNTPLTGISSYAQMLLGSTPPSDPRHELLRKVERQTFRASNIVNRLLEFSRSARPDPEPVPLIAVWREAVDLLDTPLQKAAVEVRWAGRAGATEGSRGEREEIYVNAGSEELQQVATNLVLNACEALDEQRSCRGQDEDGAGESAGTITITVQADEHTATVWVDDDGPGISDEVLPRIFHPFVSTKTERGGTGLGLAISYEIVRRYDGSLSAENRPQGGCRFELQLPLAARRPRASGRREGAGDEEEVVH